MLNDRRERNGDNIHAPAQRPEAVATEVQAQLDNLKKELEKLTGDKPSFIDQERRKGTPFSPRVTAAEIPSKFKMPVLPNYTGKEDQVSHVNKFEIQMDIQKVSEDARCRIFPATLSDAAQEWYFKFPASSIDSLEQFVQDFYMLFYAGRIHPIEANQFVDIMQKEDESLKAYI